MVELIQPGPRPRLPEQFLAPIHQQWGIPLIAAAVAILLIDAQLQTRGRDRGESQANRERHAQHI